MMDKIMRWFYTELAGILPKDLVYLCAIRVCIAAHDRKEMPPEISDQLALLMGKWTTHYNSLYPSDKDE